MPYATLMSSGLDMVSAARLTCKSVSLRVGYIANAISLYRHSCQIIVDRQLGSISAKSVRIHGVSDKLSFIRQCQSNSTT